MRPSLRLSAALLALIFACGGKGDGTGTSTTLAASTGDGTSTGASTTHSSGGHTGTTHEPTTGGSSSGTSSTGTGASTLVSSTSASSETGEPVSCGELTCAFGQVCVLPCCGGPAPACTDPDGQGQCPDGAPPVPVDRCFGGCAGPLCCPPTPCQADPPFCAAPEELQCAGNQCSVGSCFGQLTGDTLECQCA